MHKYRVFFNQINSTFYDVSASNKEEAFEKAKEMHLDSVADLIYCTPFDDDDVERA